MPGMYKYSMEIESNVKKLLLDTKELQDRMDTLEGKEYKINLNIDEKKLGNVISNLEKMLDSLGKGTGDFKQFENLSKELSSIVSEVQSLSKAFGKVDDSGAKTLLSSIQNIDKSLSDLSQNILNVNKNMNNMGGNTNGAVKQVENITNESKKAASALKDVAKAQEKVNGQKTNISLGDSSTTSANAEIKANSEVIASIEKKKQELASYEFKLEETRYEIEKLSKAENEAYGFKKAYSNMNDKYINSRKESLYNSIFGTDKSKGQGSMKYQTMNFGGNVEKGYAAWREELERLGYTLSELRKTNIGVEADIIPIDGRAITNAEEFRKVLFGITSVPSDNIKVLNQQISELESKISSLKSEISSLESVSNNPKKDAFPDQDVSASVESATNSIKEENNVLEQNTQKVKENTQVKEQNANVNLSKYDKRLDSYNGKIDKYKTTIDRFNDGGWTSSAYLENVQAVKNAVKEYETLLNELKGKDANLVTSEDIAQLDKYEKKIKDTIATVTNMSASEKGYNFVSGQKELDKIHKLLNENSKMSSEAKAKIRAYYAEIESGNPSMSLDRIHGEIMKIYNAEVEAGRAGRSFFDTLKNSGFHQIAAQMAGMFGLYDAINLGKEGFNVVRELNTALTEMRKVSDESLQSLKNYQNTTFDTADAVGTTAKQIQASTADYMRLGETLDEAAESAKTANVLLNVSEFDNIEDATKSIVAMGQAYKDLDKMTIVDKLNEVGNNYAISTDELATALQKSAATLSLMGNTIDEAASLVTTANATIQDADSVSAGLRTISLRLVGTEEAEKELSAMNEEVDAFVKATNSKKQQIIKDYTAVDSNNYQGFDILDSNGNYKNTYEILLGIAKVYKEIQEQDKKLGTNHATALIEELAGKNRSNIASAILQDPTQLEAVKKSSEEAMGSAQKELNSYLDSIDGKMAQLENRAQEFWFKVIDSETIKNGIGLLSTLFKGATDFVDTVGLLPTVIAPIAAILGKGKSSQRFCPIW